MGFEPTCRLRDNTLSRRAPSSTRSPLRVVQAAVICRCLLFGCRCAAVVLSSHGGEGGIRTLEWAMNPLHDFESCAINRTLPPLHTRRYLLLSVVEMAPPARFERATRNLGGCCSIQTELRGHRAWRREAGSVSRDQPASPAIWHFIPVCSRWAVVVLLLCWCKLARSARFERATPGSAGQCSIP